MKLLASLRLLQKRVFQLLIFFLPTQLSKHFWPEWSLVYGIRVDYLAPTIYVTDLLILLLLALKTIDLFLVRKSIKYTTVDLVKKSLPYLFLIVLVFGNLSVAGKIQPAVYKWIKTIGFVAFGLFVAKEKRLQEKHWIICPLAISTAVVCFIAIAQFYFQRSIGGVLYFLGERSFNASTPAIALTSVFGKEILRPYSTFSHPNSLAGFLLVTFLVIIFYPPSRKTTGGLSPGDECVSASEGFRFAKEEKMPRHIKEKYFGKEFLKILIIISLLTTFSLGSWIALFIVVPTLLILKASKHIYVKIPRLILFLSIIVSLLLPLVATSNFFNKQQNNEKIFRRLELAKASGIEISKSPFLGVGLNNFVIKLPETDVSRQTVWWLQPVHNMFLLVLSETGVLGMIVFVAIIILVLNKLSRGVVNKPARIKNFWFSSMLNKKSKRAVVLTVAVLAIIITGLFDHYWLTLQQNQLLFTLILGLSLRKNI